MMKETPEFRIYYNPGTDSQDMMVIRQPHKINGLLSEEGYEILVPTWKKVKRGQSIPPTFCFTYHRGDSLQGLFNQLWKEGFRPKDGTGNSGHVEALKYHLEDMRKLVFKE